MQTVLSYQYSYGGEWMLALTAIVVGFFLAFRMVALFDAYLASEDDRLDALLLGLLVALFLGVRRQ